MLLAISTVLLIKLLIFKLMIGGTCLKWPVHRSHLVDVLPASSSLADLNIEEWNPEDHPGGTQH